MKEFTIITEIENLSIGTSGASMLIADTKYGHYYLYSGDFIEKLNEINETIKKLKCDDLPSIFSMNINQITKAKNTSTYIIFKQELDMSLKARGLINQIAKPIRAITRLFSIFLKQIFDIKKIFFFENKKYGYEFCRIIDIDNPNSELYNASPK